MDPIRVLFLSRKWPPAVGGMETYAVELSCEMERLGIELDFSKLVLKGRADGRPPHPLATLLYFFRAALHIVINRRNYDVIHFGDMTQIGLAWLSRTVAPNIRNVVALHGLDVIYGRRVGVLPRMYNRYLRFLRGRKCVDCFVANSRYTAKLLSEEGFGPVRVVPLAVRLPNDSDRPPVAAPGEKPFVLFFGRIFPRKGPRWFAENVIPLLRPDVNLYVVGTIWDSQDGAYLKNHPRVRMCGAFPTDISRLEFEDLKRQATAVVMPNIKNTDGLDVEGFGLTALEAADNGAPLVAANLEGIQDAVMHGVTGFLEEPEDAPAWAARINGLLQWSAEQRADFSIAANKKLKEYYSWQRVARDTLAIYRGDTKTV